jgi:hypothetical protein
MTNKHIRTRLKAFSVHLSLSTIAFLIILYFILLHWYPKPHFTVNGGWQGIRIMLFVDIVLGPCLTLLLFNPKKSLKAILFDLSMIGIIQISAFTWGAFAVHSQRPVALSLSEGVIYPVLEEELTLQEKSPVEIQSLDNGKPPVVYAREPVTAEEHAGAVAYDFTEGIISAKLFFLMEPIKQRIDELFMASLENTKNPPEKFLQIKTEYLKNNKYKEGELAFVPFEGRYGNSLLIFNHEGKVIDSIPDPR